MGRKQKIIVSITGIVIVVLALLGLTYAYFVTQIQDNDNNKSLEVTTANLRLVYRDGNGSITASNIMPGTEVSSKEFTVTNEGNAESSYITVFENVLYTDTKTDPVTQINSFLRQEDLKYTLTCKQFNASDVETGTCDGVENVTFPTATTMSLIVSNNIPVGYVHKYVLSLSYLETGVDQSDDMGKSLSTKVNIRDVRMSNPYATIGGTAENPVEEANGTLAYNIINNAKLNKNKTSLVNVPLTKPAVSPSDETEKILSVTQDDYGTSYYFRGNVEDNYVNFAGMCWRIVRIEGDGSIKILLDDSAKECNNAEYTGNWTIGGFVVYGYDSNNKADFLNYSGGLADALKTFQGTSETPDTLTTKISSTYTGKTITDFLKAGDWCYDNTFTLNEYGLVNYGPYNRTEIDKKPMLHCVGTKIASFNADTLMYVGALTADEIVFAGESDSMNYTYLTNDYQKNNNLTWWALSPRCFYPISSIDYAYSHFSGLSATQVNSTSTSVARSAITLKKDVEIVPGGQGTKTKPYVIKDAS